MQAKPRPAATPEQALSAMDHLIATHPVGQHEITQQFGINVTDLTCFAYIMEASESLLAPGDLAARVHVTTGAVTGILNRLEHAGYRDSFAALRPSGRGGEANLVAATRSVAVAFRRSRTLLVTVTGRSYVPGDDVGSTRLA
ncbi:MULTISPECIES: hypothetical protein [Streptomyces]|uniref:hypothetical protein n=1 Tax=Streptomyces TaxID=1883 RepID=UPI0020353E38|nr:MULTISPECIES: hypothetical protein [Streptomyces]UUA07585.1 hypothetical protein NNW98_19485 [Streptomyces koelreuteriae]UUA15213.1 hypothetical protein NNW99_19480 [Streptomyces sp. CRCS-T-1]